MDENDGSGLEIRDGTLAALEALLAGTRPERPDEDKPAPRSEAARIFSEWLDRNPPS
jgi:hypothetical protein